jgi:bis(5'-nucleosyl)-tetraphosphatase (symmetrical)
VSTFLIGDVQGCFDELQALLAACHFHAAHDHIIFLGDLVNRGPKSLQVLQFAMSLGDRAQVVLGNHDLHLLAVAAGVRPAHKHDTLDAVLQHPELDAMLHWLRHQRMALMQGDLLVVHAGVVPQWNKIETTSYAHELEAVLQSNDYQRFLDRMYGNEPAQWHSGLRGAERLRVIVNVLTRLRFCTADGVMDFHTKEGADGAPEGFMPWFDVPTRRTRGTRIAFGHWSTLGLKLTPDLIALDTGCVWGGQLSALRLADDDTPEQLFQVRSTGHQNPQTFKRPA